VPVIKERIEFLTTLEVTNELKTEVKNNPGANIFKFI